MCGITGFWQSRLDNEKILTQCVQVMNDALIHRGPDDGGVWVDSQAGLALGNRRLAIIDLSPAGHQPMTSSCERYVITYNGEVYNFAEVRKELEAQGKRFHSHTDTEVILAACAHWGVLAAAQRFIGMFAFALWDRKERSLTLVRDRLGIKPLYYGWCQSTFLFGSELKALRAYPDFASSVDRNSLALFLRHGYIPAPYSIYQNIFKLLPGQVLTLSHVDAQPTLQPFWSAKDVVEQGQADLCEGDATGLVERLDELLRDAVRLRMIADVPLGAFLSGGVDSSTVVALMQAQSNRPVKTFTIGFHEDSYNEAQHAKQVAQHLGTEHTELYVTPEQAQAVIPQLPRMYDEPFADSSQIPTFLVSKLARQHVTVSLSGDGGDELFGGYNHYSLGRSLWQRLCWLPGSVKALGAKGIRSVSPQQWENLFQRLGPLVPEKLRLRLPGDKLHKLADLLGARSPEAMYHQLISLWRAPGEVVIDAQEPLTLLTDDARWAQVPTFTERMMYLDLVTYLPDDILAKVDRASMSVSLEARVPLLDHRVVAFAWRLPLSLKIRNGQSKWLLRQVLYRYVPQGLIERPKMGFGVPIDSWLRGPLRGWADALLDEGRLKHEGFFHLELIRQKWDEHQSGRHDWQYLLWNVLMFQAWQEHWLQ